MIQISSVSITTDYARSSYTFRLISYYVQSGLVWICLLFPSCDPLMTTFETRWNDEAAIRQRNREPQNSRKTRPAALSCHYCNVNCCMLCWCVYACYTVTEETLINVLHITWQWQWQLKHLNMMPVTCREPGYSSQCPLPPQRGADECFWLCPAAASRPQTDSVGWMNSLWRPGHAGPQTHSPPAHPGSEAQKVDPVEEISCHQYLL